MNQTCFVCNTLLGIGNSRSTKAVNIFTETSSNGSTLAGVLSSLLEHYLSEDNDQINSQLICTKCHKLCVEYQAMQSKLHNIKTELMTKFIKKTQAMIDSSHDRGDLSAMPQASHGKVAPPKPKVRLVLPASKLKPLPPNYIVNANKLIASPKKPQVVSISTSQGTPTTITPSLPMYSLQVNNKMSTISDVNEGITNSNITTENNDQVTNCDDGTEISINQGSETAVSTYLSELPANKSSMIEFEVNTLPNDFLESDKGCTKAEGECGEDIDDDQELPMEIDEDCTYVRVQAANTEISNDDDGKTDNETSPSFVTVLANGSSASVFGMVKILRQEHNQNNNADEDQHETIIMEDENGSILQMLSGQKLLYSGGDLTLMMSSDQEDDGDGNDSNEESQIELQVSDDEETAKAIIAAANEQGGAFIKVESGEMYRVKSVTSISNDDPEDNTDALPYLDMVRENHGIFTCSLCKNSAKGDEAELIMPVIGNAEDMMQHLKTKHNARLYICRVCNRVLRRRADLVSHLKSHEGTQPSLIDKTKQYSCDICDKKYSSKTLLQEHKNVHTGERPYACPVCDKTFASKYVYQAHLKTHSERPRPYQCALCPKAFLNMQNLTQHQKTHQGIKDFVCTTCKKAFSTQHNLEVHQVVHLGMKPFSCETCGKGFARRNEVKDHMRTHTGERPFECDICGAAFSQRSNLATHKRATHLKESRYHCSQCPKKFKRRRLLEYHIKASHTGERPLVCEVCNATFVYPEHYRKHQRIHSGDKPYYCEVCGKTFNSRDNRNTHRFVHSDKKPYECLVCGAGYMRKQLLYAHMNSSGHLAESIVVNQPRVQKVKVPCGSSKGLEIVPANDDNTESDELTKMFLTDPLSIDSDKKYVCVLNIEGRECNLEPRLSIRDLEC